MDQSIQKMRDRDNGGNAVGFAIHRLGFIDSFRGLAMILIVLFHMIFIPQPNLDIPSWAMWARVGGMGVTLFFLVCSFSLYFSMRIHKRERSQIFSFYIRRFFRIAPLFYFWIILTLVRDKIMFDLSHSLFEISANLLFLFNFIPGKQEGFVWASWMIGVLMVFYFLFPLIYKFTDNAWKAVGLFFWAMLAAAAFKGLLVYSLLDANMQELFFRWCFIRHFPVFAFGIFMYFLFVANIEKKTPQRSVGFAVIGAAAIGFVALLQGKLDVFMIDPYYWQAVLFAGLVLGFAIYPMALVVNRATRFLGKISYSLYLNHPTLILLLIPVYRQIYNWPVPLTLQYLCAVALTFGILIPLSYLTYQFIEVPGIRLGKKLLSRKASKDGSP